MKQALAALLALCLAAFAAPAAADVEKDSTGFTYPYNSANW